MLVAGRDIGSLFASKNLVIGEEGGQVLSDTALAKFRSVLFSVFIQYLFDVINIVLYLYYAQHICLSTP